MIKEFFHSPHGGYAGYKHSKGWLVNSSLDRRFWTASSDGKDWRTWISCGVMDDFGFLQRVGNG